MEVIFNLNGKKQLFDVRPDERLSETLRNSGCVSVKEGCKQGACGACTVWVDEKPMLSCLLLSARMEGKNVTTLEGVQEEAKVFAKYFISEGAEACGFCAPGFVMTVLAMERELKDPTPEQVKEYLNGCLCRCTGYVSKSRAVQKYLDEFVRGNAEHF